MIIHNDDGDSQSSSMIIHNDEENDDQKYSSFVIHLSAGENDCTEYEQKRSSFVIHDQEEDSESDVESAKQSPQQFRLPIFREPSQWEMHLLALERGEWIEGMSDAAFKRWKGKERKAVTSSYFKPAQVEDDASGSRTTNAQQPTTTKE